MCASYVTYNPTEVFTWEKCLTHTGLLWYANMSSVSLFRSKNDLQLFTETQCDSKVEFVDRIIVLHLVMKERRPDRTGIVCIHLHGQNEIWTADCRMRYKTRSKHYGLGTLRTHQLNSLFRGYNVRFFTYGLQSYQNSNALLNPR